MNRKIRASISAAFITVVALLAGIGLTDADIRQVFKMFDSAYENNEAEENYEKGIVTRIVDGDTLVVQLDTGEEKVRLIGIDTPESTGKYKDNPEPFGEVASNYVMEMVLNKVVYLETDVSETDKYDRLLRYVWLEEPDKEDFSKMLNVLLLSEGLAVTMSVDPDTKYEDLFKEYEEMAQNKQIGIWN